MKILTRFALMLLAILYMAFIWIQSSYFDPESLSGLSSHISFEVILFLGIVLELSHLIEFGVLYVLFIMVFLSFGKLTYPKELLGIMLALFYGIMDEIHQLYVPFRSASFVDLIKDTIGILVFWWLIHRNYYRKPLSRFSRAMRKVTQINDSGNGL